MAEEEELDLARFEHYEGNGAWEAHNWGLGLVESYVDPAREVAIGRYPDAVGGGWCIEQGLSREVHSLEGPYASPEAAWAALMAARDLQGHAIWVPAPEQAGDALGDELVAMGAVDEGGGAYVLDGYVYEPGWFAEELWAQGNGVNLVPVAQAGGEWLRV